MVRPGLQMYLKKRHGHKKAGGTPAYYLRKKG